MTQIGLIAALKQNDYSLKLLNHETNTNLNLVSQGEYLKHWLRELASIPGDKIHQPWKLTAEEQKRFGVRLGVDYPRPVVDFFRSVKANEKIYQASG